MKRISRKSVVVALVVTVLVALALYGLLALRERRVATRAEVVPVVRPALTVTTVLPQAERLPLRLAANGNIAAWQEAIIGSDTAGLRITAVHVNVGDVVRAGQPLVSFSDDVPRAELAQARAALLEAEAVATEARGNAERARTLQNSGAMSTQQINQYITAAETAAARVAAARATLEARQIRQQRTRLLAPEAGTIATRTATVGAVVGSGAELLRMIRLGRLEWRAEVTGTELTRLRPGLPVRVSAANGTDVSGRVRMLAPTVDPQTRLALVYVDLQTPAGPGAPLRPGMYASGTFELGESPALTVPQRALVVRDGFNYVFRLKADNRVSQIKVETGRRVGDRVEIPAGIDVSTRLVLDGAGFLNDGDLVRPEDAPAVAPARNPA